MRARMLFCDVVTRFKGEAIMRAADKFEGHHKNSSRSIPSSSLNFAITSCRSSHGKLSNMTRIASTTITVIGLPLVREISSSDST